MGAPQGQVVLGQTLRVWVPIEGDGDDASTPGCVTADVQAGEVTLPANQVRVKLVARSEPGQWMAQVSTTSPVEEPVLRLTLATGCTGKLARQYVLLADPPLQTADVTASAAPVRAAAPEVSELPKVATPSSSQPRKRSSASNSSTHTRPVEPGAAPAHAKASGAGRPRLQLDAVEPPVMVPSTASAAASVAQAALPATQAASAEAAIAASQPASTASADDAALQVLRRNAEAMRLANEDLRHRLEASEQRNTWLLMGLGGVVLALGVGGVLLWQRQRALMQSRPWWSEEHDPRRMPAGKHDEPEEETEDWSHSDTPAAVPPAKNSGFEAPSEWVREPQPVPPSQQTMPLPEAGVVASTVGLPVEFSHTDSPSQGAFNPSATMTFGPVEAPREVSVEELLDLEQQADFFIALGQEDAAVEVLMSHLRSTGGQSPLPYTKLLEIYRRQGDRSAYERVRARFNRRFNAYAPDWDLGPLHGRPLEDYPEAVGEIESAWKSPLDAMAVLEGMLFRRDETRELFDLPAYRDLLVLYAIARDLWQAAGGQHDQVDLLLPMFDAASTSAGPDLDAMHLDLELDPPPASTPSSGQSRG
ncbi:FimV family protein [Ideonella sp. B508-1]|uniref:type IV pilus assembly protein FimV n=1 Tax=Ideonella sp. B508-1 TaxID=137716 RepID=UPI00058B5540|nr:hypothetical protein [Ideonella sp. B508-1]